MDNDNDNKNPKLLKDNDSLNTNLNTDSLDKTNSNKKNILKDDLLSDESIKKENNNQDTKLNGIKTESNKNIEIGNKQDSKIPVDIGSKNIDNNEIKESDEVKEPEEDLKTNIIENKLEESTKIVFEEIKEKEEKIKKLKKRFVIARNVIIIIFLISTIFYAINFYLSYKNKTKEQPFKENLTIPENLLDLSSKVTPYKNDEIMININFPIDAKILENKSYDGRIRNIEIMYSPNNGYDTNNKLIEGFLVKITPLELSRNTLDDVANVKRESFYTICGSNSQISSIRSDVIDNNFARSFDVRNCDGDFKVTYTYKFGIFYEIQQLYKGDLGFIQQYKIATQEIVSTLSFYSEEPIKEEPFKEYAGNNIIFRYPNNLQLGCCEVPETNSNSVKLVEVGIKDSQNRVGSFGVFSQSKFKQRGVLYTFEEYVEAQKKSFIEDYTIVNNGIKPVYLQEQVSVGGRNAIRLKGISWKGNEIIFISSTNNRYEDNFISISIVNKIGEDFENTLNDIFDSFEFEFN